MSELCAYIRTLTVAKAGQQIVHEIRVDIFSHIQKLSFNYFDSRPRGKILVRVVHYVNNVADFLSNGLIKVLIMIISMALGTLIGELIDIDKWVNRLGDMMEKKFSKEGEKGNFAK